METVHGNMETANFNIGTFNTSLALSTVSLEP